MLSKVFVAASRILTRAALGAPKCITHKFNTPSLVSQIATRNFTCLSLNQPQITPILNNTQIVNSDVQKRGVIKYSYRKGKRKTVRAVLKRFYRLNWGMWIRTKCGRQKKLWKKTSARKRRLRQHVFCNATQSWMLDKMVGPFWRKPRYYVDDPYEPYHQREEFIFTAKKPRPYIPPEDRI